MVFVLILKVNLKPSRMWEMHFFALELNFTNLVARKRKYSWSQHQIDLPFCISYYTTSFWFCFSMSRYFCLLSSLSWEFPLEFSTILPCLPPLFQQRQEAGNYLSETYIPSVLWCGLHCDRYFYRTGKTERSFKFLRCRQS